MFSFRKINSKPILIALLIMTVVAMTVLTVKLVRQQSLLDHQIESYNAAKVRLQNANEEEAALSEKKEQVQTDAYKEKMARDNGYVDEDETVFVYSIK